MTVADVLPAFLAACPTIKPAWESHLASWGDETERGHFNDAAVVAHHIVDRFERGDLTELPAVFAVLERCLAEGDKEARGLATVGIIEDIQNIASHRDFGPDVFLRWLGPLSRAAWDELCVFWGHVMEAKAAGLLDPTPDAGSRAVDPSEIEDPALRRMMEQMHRRELPGPLRGS